jgi:hypothetical protein
MASKYHRVYQGFQKLFNPSAKKKTDIPTTIIGVKPGKNLKERRKVKDEVFKSIDEKGKGLSLEKRSKIKKSFSEKASKIFDKASKARKNKMGGGMMGRRMGYSQGKLAVTPREKQLAAQYGDKKRITRGDVITAAKKKSGKRMQARSGTEDPKPKLMLNNIELVTTEKNFKKKPKSPGTKFGGTRPKPKDRK